MSDDLRQEFDYPGVRQAFCIEREVRHYRRDRVAGSGTAIGITSLGREQADAQALLSCIRGHWTIEAVHHILDHRNGRNEDHCRIRKGFGPENMSPLRRLAIAVIRHMGRPVAPTLRRLRGNAGMVPGNTRGRTVCRE